MTAATRKDEPRGDAIGRRADGALDVPDRPIVPFIEGDGIGVDVTPVMRSVVDNAVRIAYGGDRRRIVWHEIYAGDKGQELCGEWLSDEVFDAMRRYRVSIKGPLTTPIGKGMRSLNVEIRQRLDLYACVRPIRYFPGVDSPLKRSDTTDMVVFRENTEDIYAGIEWPAGSPEVKKLLAFLRDEMGVIDRIRFPGSSGLGIKPVSKEGSQRLIRMALRYAIDNGRRSVTLVHKGNIMKYTEGAFCNWGYALADEEFGAERIGDGPWRRIVDAESGREIIVKDVISDNFLQQILLRPDEYDVIATLNLNGDYISDALAAQVGGLGIAPGANISDDIAVFEATHGSAPKYAGKNRVNPGSIILSSEMMLRHMGWSEAADLVIEGVARAIACKTVTYDLARVRGGIPAGARPLGSRQDVDTELQRLMPGAVLVTTSGFGEEVVKHMEAAGKDGRVNGHEGRQQEGMAGAAAAGDAP